MSVGSSQLALCSSPLSKILLIALLVVGSTSATIGSPPSAVPDAFKTEMTSLLQGLKIGQNIKQELLDSLMTELINLYVLLLNFH